MLAAVLMAVALHAVGPSDTVAGRVVRVTGRDTVAAAGAIVVLHRVTPEVQGPVDSIRSDANGRFRLRTPADSGAILLVSARWHGIEYFSAPLVEGARPPSLQLVVADTASDAVVTVAARHLVIGAPAPDGTRNAVDLFVLANDGSTTRVAPDSLTPTWRLVLPPNVVNVVLGETDFADEALHLHGDTLELTASIPPGQRQLLINYQVPPATRRLLVPYDDRTALANILLEEVDAEAIGTLIRADTATVEGRHYTRWSGVVAAGSTVELRFGGAGRLPGWVMEAVAGLFAVGLIGMALYSARMADRATPAAVVQDDSTPVDGLLDAMARLDAAHLGREAELSPGEWQAYLSRRAALKEEIRALLPS
jgi:hypothetical protein